MMKTLTSAIAILALAVATATGAPSVAGTWSVAVVDSPHGPAAISLALQQDGTRVTGTFAISGHAPDMALEGEFVDGVLKLETTGDGDHKVIFNAKLKDDGTLAGSVSGPMGEMQWTAERVKDRK
jgi:hypothetical protein